MLLDEMRFCANVDLDHHLDNFSEDVAAEDGDAKDRANKKQDFYEFDSDEELTT